MDDKNKAPNRVTVYSSQHCAYCRAVKQLLEKRAISFREVDMATLSTEERDTLFQLSGIKTIPQVFIDGKFIGGFMELSALDQKDGLQALMKE